MQKLKLSLINRDTSLQPRAELRSDWAEEYAVDMANGAEFPPIVVFFDGTFRGVTTYPQDTTKIGHAAPMLPVDEVDEDLEHEAAEKAEEEDAEDPEDISFDAIFAIETLASLPSPEIVIDALMKCGTYGELADLLACAREWFEKFTPLYYSDKPRECESVEREAAGGG